MPTPQENMKAGLAKTGIPSKEIQCYGSQIVIVAWSEDAAKRWASLLSNFATVRSVVKSMDETKDLAGKLKANPGLVKSHFYHDVWIVAAAV